MKLYHSDDIDFYRHEDAFAQNKGINLSLTNATLLKNPVVRQVLRKQILFSYLI